MAQEDLSYKPRPRWFTLIPGMAMLVGLSAWFNGGSTGLNNVAWLIIGAYCAIGMAEELRAFPRRFGVGGLVFYSGVIVWFFWDYMKMWSGLVGYPPDAGLSYKGITGDLESLSKATFYHCLFITLGTLGLQIPWGMWFSKLIAKTPQPENPGTLLALIIAIWIFSVLPYFLFTTVPWYEAIWRQIVGFKSGEAQVWTLGRTGRMNVAWTGYIGFWLRLGHFAGLLAAFYAIYMARSFLARAVTWFIWFFALAIAFGGAKRSHIVTMGAPVLGMLFIMFHVRASNAIGWVRRQNMIKAYVIVLSMAIIFFTLIQIQGHNRRKSLAEAKLRTEQFIDPRDNTMFTHSLVIFERMPEEVEPFYTTLFPGQGWIWPVPYTAFRLVTGVIPRALWRNKPRDVVSDWVNTERGQAVGFGRGGATLSNGLVGFWYGRYGMGGVVEGALLFCWLLAMMERAIWLAREKPIAIIIALGLLEWMFRSFRDFRFHQLHYFIVGLAVLWLFSFITQKIRN